MDPILITPAVLAAIAGAVLSLAFSYIPGLNTKFAALSVEAKRLIMAGLLALISVVLYFLNCGNILLVGLTCDKDGIIQLVWIFISAVVANQSVFNLTPQTNAVKAAKG